MSVVILQGAICFFSIFTKQKWFGHCYGLPVHLPYIVITCARIDVIKRVCCEPPYACCPGGFLDLLSVHDIATFESEKIKTAIVSLRVYACAN